jgi:hypothetical protein
MKLIRSNYHALQILGQAVPKLRKVIKIKIKNKDKDEDLLNAISEIVLNVLNGTVSLSNSSKRKMQKHKTALRRLPDKRVTT